MPKKKLSRKTITRLRRIKKYIEEEPLRFMMAVWGFSMPEDQRHIHEYDRAFNEQPGQRTVPSCGTVGCLAGWAVTLYDKDWLKNALKRSKVGSFYDGGAKAYPASTMLRARLALGLTPRQASRLFVLSGWPSDYEIQFNRTPTPQKRAKLAGEVIENFISTDGWPEND